MAVPAITLGILTIPEAFIFFGLPAALIFRLAVGLIAGARYRRLRLRPQALPVI
jgi:hypothetical protein